MDPNILISRYLDGVMDRGDFDTLCQWIKADPENARRFVLACSLDRLLSGHFDALGQLQKLNLDDCQILPALSDCQILLALSDAEPDPSDDLAAPTIGSTTGTAHPDIPRATQVPADKARRPGVGRYLPTGWKRVALIALPLILSIAVYRRFDRRFSGPVAAPQLATLTGSRDAKLGDAPAAAGETFAARSLNLKTGVLELTMASGATVIVEAPAQFSLVEANRLRLDRGKLSAVVPEQAHGFTVETPSGSVIDLGTEFGVSVAGAGQTRVEVFKGKVHILATPAAGRASAPVEQVLTSSQAAVLKDGAVQADAVGASRQHFVRTLDEQPLSLDLVDLLCRGDGTTHRRGMGINRSGRSIDAIYFDTHIGTPMQQVPDLPVVDCVFSPSSPGRGRTSVPVDTAGHQFVFPPNDSKMFGPIWAGGDVDLTSPNKTFRFSARLGDTDYARQPHGLIFIHPNRGLTLDLQAIRRLHPGLRIIRFHAGLANGFTVESVRRSRGTHQPRANIFVLVDGQRRIEQLNFAPQDQPVPLDVSISDQDRFLTLVTLGSGVGGSSAGECDWIFFGDPSLETARR